MYRLDSYIFGLGFPAEARQLFCTASRLIPGPTQRPFLSVSAAFFLCWNARSRKLTTYAYTVQLYLSGLIGTTSHSDIQKIRIIGFVFENKLYWQFEVGEKILQAVVLSYIFICIQIKHLYIIPYMYLIIWIDFDRASSLICRNKMPARCNRWFLLQILLLAQHVSGHHYAHHQELESII